MTEVNDLFNSVKITGERFVIRLFYGSFYQLYGVTPWVTQDYQIFPRSRNGTFLNECSTCRHEMFGFLIRILTF
jgi:hypothetical protein